MTFFQLTLKMATLLREMEMWASTSRVPRQNGEAQGTWSQRWRPVVTNTLVTHTFVFSLGGGEWGMTCHTQNQSFLDKGMAHLQYTIQVLSQIPASSSWSKRKASWQLLPILLPGVMHTCGRSAQQATGSQNRGGFLSGPGSLSVS